MTRELVSRDCPPGLREGYTTKLRLPLSTLLFCRFIPWLDRRYYR